jgi:Cupin-like domain
MWQPVLFVSRLSGSYRRSARRPAVEIKRAPLLSLLALVTILVDLSLLILATDQAPRTRDVLVVDWPSVSSSSNSHIALYVANAKITYPIVFKNASMIQDINFEEWTAAHLASIMEPDAIEGGYRNTRNNRFGPFHDTNRPMAPQVAPLNPFDINVTFSPMEIQEFFGLQESKERKKPKIGRAQKKVYYALTTALSSFHPRLETTINLSELIHFNPKRASVNLWMGMANGVTPCHYDGYRNLYLQLDGRKKFTLHAPSGILGRSLGTYPFMHPSYGQCHGNLTYRGIEALMTSTSEPAGGSMGAADGLYETVLSPGDLLYIPPFWIHEVVSVSSSVSINVWTDIAESEIFQQVKEIVLSALLLDLSYNLSIGIDNRSSTWRFLC